MSLGIKSKESDSRNGLSHPVRRPNKKIHILFLAASPRDTYPLDLRKEFDAIDQALVDFKVRDKFYLEINPHTSLTKLPTNILRSAPNVIHFSCNGTSDCLVFENKIGGSEKADVDTLKEIFEIISKRLHIGCVILSACSSGMIAKAIAEYADCAIYMPGIISDKAAIVFTSTFYEAIANSLNMVDAVRLGIIELKREFGNVMKEQEMPKIIYHSDIDPSKLTILPQPQYLAAPIHYTNGNNIRGEPEEGENMDEPSRKIFIVHGHDPTKHALTRILEKLGLEPIILQEMAHEGKSYQERFEYYASQVGYAFVFLSPDDLGGEKEKLQRLKDLKPRARQNVIFELGYFMAKLGRNRVCCFYRGEVERPSDLHGITYYEYEFGRDFMDHYPKIIKELRSAGYKRINDDLTSKF